jgi:hypothetical protein
MAGCERFLIAPQARPTSEPSRDDAQEAAPQTGVPGGLDHPLGDHRQIEGPVHERGQPREPLRDGATPPASARAVSPPPWPPAAEEEVLDRRVGAHPFQPEGDVLRDGLGEAKLGLRERVDGVVVHHERSNQPAVVEERDEGQRANALGVEHLAQRGERRVCPHVLDGDRAGGMLIRRPRGVSAR